MAAYRFEKKDSLEGYIDHKATNKIHSLNASQYEEAPDIDEKETLPEQTKKDLCSYIKFLSSKLCKTRLENANPKTIAYIGVALKQLKQIDKNGYLKMQEYIKKRQAKYSKMTIAFLQLKKFIKK